VSIWSILCNQDKIKKKFKVFVCVCVVTVRFELENYDRQGDSPTRPIISPLEDYLRGEIFICVCVDVGAIFFMKNLPTTRLD